jgi:acyl dehydratase
MTTSRFSDAVSAFDETVYYWDDLETGFTYETATRTITETDVVAFAAFSADYNLLHVDAEYAKASAFGQRIAHGMLVASIVAGLNTRTVVNAMLAPSLLGLLEVKATFPKPTFIGDTIGVKIEVAELKTTSKPDRGLIRFLRSAINQRGETVCVCDVLMLMKRRPGTAG